MNSAYRPVAVLALIAAGLIPAALAGSAAASPSAGARPAAGRPGAAPPGGTRLWAARFDGGTGRSGTASSVTVSPNGATAYVTGITSFAGAMPMNTYDTVAYNAATGATLWEARFHGSNGLHPEGTPVVAVSPDGSKVFVFGHFPSRSFGFRGEYLMLTYDAATGNQLWTFSGVCQEPAPVIAVSPDSSTVYVTGTQGSAYCTLALNSSTGAVRWQTDYVLGQHIHAVANSLALNSSGSALFVTGTAGTVAYAASTGAQLWADHYKQRWGRSHEHVAVSPNGSTVFVAGETHLPATQPPHFLTVAYNASTGAQLWTAQQSPSTCESFATGVAVSPGGSTVFVTGPSLTCNATQPEYLTTAYGASTGTALWVRRLADPGGNFATLPSLTLSPAGPDVIVAGSSKEANGQYGYMTAAYAAATGHRLWLARYQGPGGASSTASAVAVTGTEVFVTGSAVDNSTLTDYQTVGLQG